MMAEKIGKLCESRCIAQAKVKDTLNYLSAPKLTNEAELRIVVAEVSVIEQPRDVSLLPITLHKPVGLTDKLTDTEGMSTGERMSG